MGGFLLSGRVVVCRSGLVWSLWKCWLATARSCECCLCASLACGLWPIVYAPWLGWCCLMVTGTNVTVPGARALPWESPVWLSLAPRPPSRAVTSLLSENNIGNLWTVTEKGSLKNPEICGSLYKMQ